MASHAAAHGLRLPLRTGDGPVRPRVAARPNFACRIGVRIPFLHAVLAQLAEAQVLGTWRSGFESPGRY
jgi:hypothetical protein